MFGTDCVIHQVEARAGNLGRPGVIDYKHASESFSILQ